MKIVLDTVTKQAVCPPEFFESIRKINDASELTESSKKVITGVSIVANTYPIE